MFTTLIFTLIKQNILKYLTLNPNTTIKTLDLGVKKLQFFLILVTKSQIIEKKNLGISNLVKKIE